MAEVIGFHASDGRWFICFVVWVLGFDAKHRQIFPSLFSLLHRSGTQTQTLHNQLTSLLKFKQGLKVGREDSFVGRVLTKQARGPKFRSPALT